MDIVKYYEAYYMMTAKCNLSCSYCILENSPTQIAQELALDKKKELIHHLYHNFGVRSLTISGGEPLRIGDNNGQDFIELVNYLKQFKSLEPQNNLAVKMYSNCLLLTDEIASSMQGVVDCVSINIDSYNDDVLKKIGRTNRSNGMFFENAIVAIQLLYKYHIKVKLHTVISALNYKNISDEVDKIFLKVQMANPLIKKWKFYQYMSYDNLEKDNLHQISKKDFENVRFEISRKLKKYGIKLQFKSNEEMNDSLFNILATGIAQYRKDGDTWKTTRRTRNLLEYSTMNELLSHNDIDTELIETNHLYIM